VSDERKDRRDLQREVLRGELYVEVIATADALRSSHEYDLPGDHRFALLCHALERSCQVHGRVTLGGMYAALAVVKAEAKARR
jgi:hypothetical protein